MPNHPHFQDIPIDQVKAFWNHRPCNLRHSSQPVGTKAYFDEVETRKYFVEPHIPEFAEFERWRGKKVLEIGCGIGTDTINFARHGAHVTAVDLSSESLKIARNRAEVYGLENQIRFYQGDSEALTDFVPIETYDFVYSFGVIHHTPHPERVIAQLSHYTDQGSVVKVMVYYRYAWKVLWILLTYGKARFWKISELIARYSEAQTGCPVTYTYTRQDVRTLFEQQGLHVTEFRVEHIFPYRFPDYATYHYIKVWYFRWMPPRIFRWLEQHFGWHLCITARRAN